MREDFENTKDEPDEEGEYIPLSELRGEDTVRGHKDWHVVLPIVFLIFASFLYLSSASKNKKILPEVLVPVAPKVYTDEYYNSLTWSEVISSPRWGKRDSHESYQWNGRMYLFGGLDGGIATLPDGGPDYEKAKYYNDIWVTDDGEHWSLITEHADLPYLRSMSIVPFKNKLYLIAGWGPEAGLNHKIYTSEDGVHWTVAASSTPYRGREGQRVLEQHGALYMFGGVDYYKHETLNDVWKSTDGVTWEPLTLKAPWHSRWDHDVGVINDTFYLVSGMSNGTTGYDDIWKSTNGTDWSLVATGTPIGKRQGHVILNYRNALWLIGGLDTATNQGKGEAWYSRDGEHWNKVPFDGAWEGREDHQAVIFKDTLFVFGGMGASWHWKGDIWKAYLTP